MNYLIIWENESGLICSKFYYNCTKEAAIFEFRKTFPKQKYLTNVYKIDLKYN